MAEPMERAFTDSLGGAWRLNDGGGAEGGGDPDEAENKETGEMKDLDTKEEPH